MRKYFALCELMNAKYAFCESASLITVTSGTTFEFARAQMRYTATCFVLSPLNAKIFHNLELKQENLVCLWRVGEKDSNA